MRVCMVGGMHIHVYRKSSCSWRVCMTECMHIYMYVAGLRVGVCMVECMHIYMYYECGGY